MLLIERRHAEVNRMIDESHKTREALVKEATKDAAPAPAQSQSPDSDSPQGLFEQDSTSTSSSSSTASSCSLPSVASGLDGGHDDPNDLVDPMDVQNGMFEIDLSNPIIAAVIESAVCELSEYSILT